MVESKHSRETDADQQGSAGIDGLMAGLPPLLLGTYTPKSMPRVVWHFPRNFVPSLARGW